MNTLTIHTDESLGRVDRHIFGHFSEHLGRCIYGGYWEPDNPSVPAVRGIRTDVVEALKAIGAPNIRWPGGCFADDYHWRDGIGPRESRPPMVNMHWGGVVENNHFGTHEFLDLCEQIGAEPYICGNVGSGTVREMRDWVEYITGSEDSAMGILRKSNGRAEPWRLPFFGVGNENWGCGGHMRPEYYADLYRRFSGYVRKAGGTDVYRIACGSHDDDYRWTEVLMREAARWFEGLSYHYYTILAGRTDISRAATDFGRREWVLTMRRAYGIEACLDRHMTIMDRYDPERRVGLIVDEWGTWHAVEPGTHPRFLYQQNTIRDAVVAGHHLNVFGNRCNRIQMANLAQTVNVLQAVLLTDGETLIKTPTYHVFEMYLPHHDGEHLHTVLDRGVCSDEEGEIPALSALCSRDEQGLIHLTVANMDPEERLDLSVTLRGISGRPRVKSGQVLVADAMQAHNTAEHPEAVRPTEFAAASVTPDGSVAVPVPAGSVLRVDLEVAEEAHR